MKPKNQTSPYPMTAQEVKAGKKSFLAKAIKLSFSGVDDPEDFSPAPKPSKGPWTPAMSLDQWSSAFFPPKGMQVVKSDALSFSLVLEGLRAGECFTRGCWDEGIYIGLHLPSSKMNQPYLYMQEGSKCYPWHPDSGDLFASDWKVKPAVPPAVEDFLLAEDPIDLVKPFEKQALKVPKKKKSPTSHVDDPTWV